MDKKDNVQNNELNKVTGGGCPIEEVIVNCQVCGVLFDPNQVESKTIGGSCNKVELFKCPKCNSWVDMYGETHNEK